ncbi:MAG TPA: prolyl oligopeptidase family serine peptidase [Kofleriaceae bacterium]|nr:prolyl oligopeptidase family serine peptidase [Kofleriaceae bacterium]
MTSEAPPPTRRGDDADLLHGERIEDPYRWLEDAAAPDVRAWMDAQDAHARRSIAALPEREQLLAGFRRLFYYDAVSSPERRGTRYFYTRKHHDREKNVVYVRDGAAEERVLFDPNTLSEDGTVSLGVWVPSHDGRLVAYALRANNADAATLHVRDVDAGTDLPDDVIAGAKYAHPSWLPDGSGFYYTRLPDDPAIAIADLPGHAEVCFHAIGTAASADRVVHPATGNAESFIHGEVSRDGRLLVVSIQHGWSSTDVYVAERERADDVFAPLVAGFDALYEVIAHGDALYIHTNEGAPRYRVMRAALDALHHDAWTELIAEDEATLESVRVVGGYLVCRYLRDARSELHVRGLEGQPVRQIDLPDLGTVTELTGEPDGAEIFYAFTSFTDPGKIFRLELPGGAPERWATVELDVDTSNIVCDQVRFRSRDGTEVPMFIIHRRDLTPANGPRPTILYGYGGFNVSLTPAFSPRPLPWLERGGVYAIPNLRGGGEYGEAWHRAGMLANKQNVFDDFIAAAEHLIASGWTTPDRLAIHGGSNGGLLVGAAMTQRPELFRAVVCAVPLLDMLRYHLFGSGRTWIPEYGSADDDDLYPVLRAYSPQQAVTESTAYPALLMLAADSDDRVDPMHARKFVAAIRHATTSPHPVLLRIERNAGHGGADMVKQMVEQAADTYAFLFDQLGA